MSRQCQIWVPPGDAPVVCQTHWVSWVRVRGHMTCPVHAAAEEARREERVGAEAAASEAFFRLLGSDNTSIECHCGEFSDSGSSLCDTHRAIHDVLDAIRARGTDKEPGDG